MIELLRRVAGSEPDRVAIIATDDRWSYGRLLAEATALAAGLHADDVRRLAVVSNDIPRVVALMAAASLVGAEACVYAPDISADDLARQVADFDHALVVTDRDDLSSPADDVTLRRPADLLGDPDAAPAEPPAHRPLLVLTTGTTGRPRGVRHDWGRQLTTVAAARDGRGQVWMLAYGPQQFAGLQVLIHVLGTGATLVSPPVRRPQAVVEAVYDHGVDHISATPTFWRFLLAELRSAERALPALRQITLGGEAAPATLLADLEATFPDARISHIYAGSEFGSTGSVRDGQGGLPASLLTRDDGPVRLRIVDGELHVRSSASMLGYHGDEDHDADEWWPTGDLVEVVGERIEFRGRRSDVINVGGVKVHPLPVEDRVGAVPGVRLARAYGRANALVGSVVAVDVVAEPDADQAVLKGLIREACADLPRPWQPRSIRFVDEAPMRGNKLVRGSE